jgi:hypothetical protein
MRSHSPMFAEMLNFILCSLEICLVSFSTFREYIQFHSLYYPASVRNLNLLKIDLIPRTCRICLVSFWAACKYAVFNSLH